MASSLSLTRSAAGTWTGRGTNLSIDGLWGVDVVVQEAATAADAQLRLPPEQIAVSRQPGVPDLYTVQLADGYRLQTYLEPGGPGPGPGVVHYTFFQPSGREVGVTSPRATARRMSW